jgi:hypothetical protein
VLLSCVLQDTLAELGILSLVPYLERRLSPCQHYHEQPQQQQPTAASQSPGGSPAAAASLKHAASVSALSMQHAALTARHSLRSRWSLTHRARDFPAAGVCMALASQVARTSTTSAYSTRQS